MEFIINRLDSQTSLLPPSFLKITDTNDSKFKIAGYGQGSASISLKVNQLESVLKLNSIEDATGDFKEYTLTLTQGKPTHLIYKSLEGTKVLDTEERQAFFETIQTRLAAATVENNSIDLTGIDAYLTRYRIIWR